MDTYLIDLLNKQWKVHIISTLLASICVTIALFAVNILTVNQLLQHGDDVLKDDGTAILHYQAGSSIVTIIMVFIFTTLKILLIMYLVKV